MLHLLNLVQCHSQILDHWHHLTPSGDICRISSHKVNMPLISWVMGRSIYLLIDRLKRDRLSTLLHTLYRHCLLIYVKNWLKVHHRTTYSLRTYRPWLPLGHTTKNMKRFFLPCHLFVEECVIVAVIPLFLSQYMFAGSGSVSFRLCRAGFFSRFVAFPHLHASRLPF
jgi:hypothetical protein